MNRAMPAFVVALLPSWAAACQPDLHGPGVQTIDGRQHVVAWRAPAPVPLAQFFAIDFAACARDGSRIDLARIDATMPEHGHGMNYRPVVTSVGDGRFSAKGLLLHMPGRWQLSFSVGGEMLRTSMLVD
jgi:hypothetical protein